MEPLYQRYSRQLCSLAYAMVTDYQVAQNLTQETFLAVWRHASAYAPQAEAVRNWLLSILRHRTIDYLRAPRRRSSLQEVRWEQVEEDEQPVITLVYFQGWTQSEIAREYGIPLGTVKARMRLGLLHLKHILDRMGFTEL